MATVADDPEKKAMEKEIMDGLDEMLAEGIADAAQQALGVDSLEAMDNETYALLFGGSPLERKPKEDKEGKP